MLALSHADLCNFFPVLSIQGRSSQQGCDGFTVPLLLRSRNRLSRVPATPLQGQLILELGFREAAFHVWAATYRSPKAEAVQHAPSSLPARHGSARPRGGCSRWEVPLPPLRPGRCQTCGQHLRAAPGKAHRNRRHLQPRRVPGVAGLPVGSGPGGRGFRLLFPSSKRRFREARPARSFFSPLPTTCGPRRYFCPGRAIMKRTDL